MVKKELKVPDLIISIDLGGSLSKICAITGDGRYCLLALLSEVAHIPPDILQNVQNNHWGEANPESQIWIETNDGQGFALGTYAREQFMAHSNLKLSKLDEAVPKILGALWVLQQKLNLESKFNVTLGVLLPSAECSNADKDELVQKLVPHLKKFGTPSGKMQVDLVGNLIVRPEGAGVYLAYKNTCEKSLFEASRIGILGIGYRNSNLLVSNRGVISAGDRHTDMLGFHSLVKSAKQEIGSAVNEIQLATIIGQAGIDINSVYLERFLRKINRLNRLKSVEEAIVRAQKMHWHQLKSWFSLIEVSSLNIINFYGGTIQYFKPRLEEYFSYLDELVWHSNIIIPHELIESIIVEREQSALDKRFIDSWCFLHYLCQPQEGFSQWGLDKLARSQMQEVKN